MEALAGLFYCWRNHYVGRLSITVVWVRFLDCKSTLVGKTFIRAIAHDLPKDSFRCEIARFETGGLASLTIRYHVVRAINRCAMGFHGINGASRAARVPSIYSMVSLLRN